MIISSVGVIGSGVMGKGIAAAAATVGIHAVLVRARPGDAADLRRVRADVAKSFDRSVERGHMTAEAREAALGRLVVTSQLDAVSGCEMVIESIVEELDVKQRLFADLEHCTSAGAVLGTNTSSLRVADVGARLVSQDRLLGIHFFSPVAAMRLVELAPTTSTAPFAVERAQALAVALGKTPVVVGDSSGYIVNRLLVPYLLDGISALEAGVASAADIDTAMRLGCGHPVGPLTLADAIGLDVVYAMARHLYLSHHDRRYSPPGLLRRLVLGGHLGKKAGTGIYDYRDRTAAAPCENPALHLLPPAPPTDADYRH